MTETDIGMEYRNKLVKAGWHSLEDCDRDISVWCQKYGWRSPEDVEKMVKLWDERFEKARQQLKDELIEKLEKGMINTPMEIAMIIDGVLK